MSNTSLLAAADQFIKDFDTKNARLTLLNQEIIRKKKERDAIVPQRTLIEEARVFIQTLAEAARKEITAGLEEIVTLCLQLTFGANFHFEINVETMRNKPAIEFWVCEYLGKNEDGSDRILKLNPEDSTGGGVVDTVATGLRFGLLRVLDPYPIGPIMLDEPAKMVSSDRIDSIAVLLKEMSRIFGKQIIMVTHHTGIVDIVDQCIHFQKIDGVSTHA